MSNLLKLEKKNQEYNFNYNCLSPLNKKNFLIWIGTYHGYNTEEESEYSIVHNLYYNKIKEYYDKIKQPEVDNIVLIEQLFNIPFSSIPKEFSDLSYPNSCLINPIDVYMQDSFFQKEFNHYWVWLSEEIKKLTNYDISTIDNTIFKHAFLSCNQQKIKNNINIESYYSSIFQKKHLSSAVYNVSSNCLQNVLFIQLLSRTLVDIHLLKFKTFNTEETIRVIENLYHLFIPNSIKNKKAS